MSGDPGVSVTDVALQCNFSNMGHFSKDFHETFGERPSENPAAFAPAMEFSPGHVQAGRVEAGVGDLDACYCEFPSRKVSKHSQDSSCRVLRSRIRITPRE